MRNKNRYMVRYNFFHTGKNHSPRAGLDFPPLVPGSIQFSHICSKITHHERGISLQPLVPSDLRSKLYRGISLLFLLLSFITHAERHVTSIIMPHSVSVNAARELAGWQDAINIFPQNHANYSSITISPEFMLNFKPERIAQCFFGDDIITCKNSLTISGSQDPDRLKRYWLADYFGLPTDYKSRVVFSPRVSNMITDIDCFIGLDKWISGLYFRMHIPLVYTSWNLNMCESFITTGSNAYDPGYVNATGASRSELSSSFISFISGNEAPEIPGVIFHPLKHGKMSCKPLTLFKVSEIECALGWNIMDTPRYHLGLNARIAIPTGNRPTGEYLFEPIVGNGHHWAAGGGISTHLMLWQDESTQEKAGIYFDANITHLFSTYQCRSFDLCANGDNSRYMLAQRMGTPIESGLAGTVNGTSVTPIAQYQNEISSVVNLTTLPVNVSASIQADIALMINYEKGRNSWGIGYGRWSRSCEDICLAGIKTPFEIASWALKGDAMAYGFEQSSGNPAIALSATESNATINHGTNFPKTGTASTADITYGQTNPAIDNPALAVADSNPVMSSPGGADRIYTSIEPVLLTGDDININSARTSGSSNRLFSHFTHQINAPELKPFLSIGAEMEFGPAATCTNKVILRKSPCINTALSLWGVWIKGGVSF